MARTTCHRYRRLLSTLVAFSVLSAHAVGANFANSAAEWRSLARAAFLDFLIASGCHECRALLEPTDDLFFSLSSNTFGCADVDVLLPSLHWLYETARKRNGGHPPGLLVDGGANVGRATARWIAALGDSFGRHVSRNKSQASCVICAGASATDRGFGASGPDFSPPTVAVVSIEPSRSNFALLRRHAVENGWAEEGFLPLQAALGAEAGHGQLAISEDFAIDEVATLLWNENDTRAKQPVQIITLPDAIAEAHKVFPTLGKSASRIFLLKLDIEGLEPTVLRSLSLPNAPATKFISFEYASNVWREGLARIIEDLFATGYFCFLITSEQLFPVSGPFWDSIYEMPMWSNLFCGLVNDPDLEALVQMHIGAVGLWPRMPGTYLAGFAGDDQRPLDLLRAQHVCTDLGQACAGVTCEEPAESHIFGSAPSGCTAREGRGGIRPSPGNEVTYLRDPMAGNLYLRYRREDALAQS